MGSKQLFYHCHSIIDAVNELEFGDDFDEDEDKGDTWVGCTREERYWADEARTLARLLWAT